MRVLVAGASGVLGQPTVRQLREAGHEVVGLVRSREGGSVVKGLGGAPIEADVLETDAVRRGMDGVEAVVNLTGTLPTGAGVDRTVWAASDKVWREGTGNLVAAAEAAGVQVFVQASLSLLYGEHGDDWVTEETPLASPKLARAALDAERAVEAATERALPGVILRLGTVYARDSWHTRFLISQARQRQLPVVGNGEGFWSLVHAEDAALAITRAVDDAEAGTVYNVADDRPIRMADLFDLIARLVGASQPMRVPRLVARAVVGADALALLTTSARLSNRAIKQDLELALRFPTVEDGLRTLLSEPMPDPAG